MSEPGGPPTDPEPPGPPTDPDPPGDPATDPDPPGDPGATEQPRPGQDALDSAGTRVGKVDALYSHPEAQEPAFVCVRVGWFGRRLTLVPLAGATMEEDFVRLAYPRQQIKDAPPIATKPELDSDPLHQIIDHYELEPVAGAPPARLIRHEPEPAAPVADDEPPPPRAVQTDDLIERLDALERRMRALQKALD